MKHQRIQNHLSRIAHLQMSQIEKHINKFLMGIRIFLKIIKFSLTYLQGSLKTRKNVLSPDWYRQQIIPFGAAWQRILSGNR